MSIKHLKGDPLFADFLDQELEWLSAAVVPREIEAGQTIIREGDQGFSLFILESGSVDVHKRTASGERPRLSTIVSGSIFGELAFGGETMRSADVIARDNVKVYELNYLAVDQLVLDHPTLGIKIYRIILKGLIEKTRKTTENLLSIVVSSRMSALGEMASGIAHEISSPLTIIQMHAEALEDVVQTDPIDKNTIRKNSNKILIMVDRIGKLIKSVRALSRNSDQDPMIQVSVQEILDQTLELCQARFKNGSVVLKQELAGSEIKLVCRPIQISQALLNLMNNAYDAVKDLDEKWVKVEVQEDAQNVIFSVTDSGKGIPEAVREKVFQSFFTTKGSGQGTGLGLSIGLKIVQGHHGTVTVDAQCPNTRFVMKLPKKQS